MPSQVHNIDQEVICGSFQATTDFSFCNESDEMLLLFVLNNPI